MIEWWEIRLNSEGRFINRRGRFMNGMAQCVASRTGGWQNVELRIEDWRRRRGSKKNLRNESITFGYEVRSVRAEGSIFAQKWGWVGKNGGFFWDFRY